MSTLKTINVQHPSASSANVTLDSSGNASVAGNLSFNSGYGSAAVAYGCRAWVNFQGTGTVTIRADGGVSSVTDDGTGAYTVNYDVALPDSNNAPVAGSNGSGIGNFGAIEVVTGTSACSVRAYRTDTNVLADLPLICVAVFR